MLKSIFLLLKGKAEVSLYFLLWCLHWSKTANGCYGRDERRSITHVTRHGGPCSAKLLTTYMSQRIRPQT